MLDRNATAHHRADAPRLCLGPVAIAALERREAFDRVFAAIVHNRPLRLAFANAHLVNTAIERADLGAALADFLVLPDGIGVDLGARIVAGRPFPANLNGTDFIPALLAEAPRPLSVALIGGRPGVADRAAQRLSEAYPQHAVTAVSHGFMGEAERAHVLGRLAAARPDLLLVAMGNPLQELWIARHVGPQHATVAAGVGALFDFLAGETPRAPAAVRQLRLEWVFRLLVEPRRLWRRYVVGNPLFMWHMVRQRWSL